jgi:hypothetical protein
MTKISNDRAFRVALDGLDGKRQRWVAARFVESVLSLCADAQIARVLQVATDPDADDLALSEALRVAKATAIGCHTRCGAEGDWLAQAGYFVARAAVAALTPRCQMPGGVAWQAAMSSRMAQTAKAIVSGEETAGQESETQYQILAEFLDA